MPLQRLKPSPDLELSLTDIDHFIESERYAGATSMPLIVQNAPIVRATLRMPTLTVSLLHTFPRIIRGYTLGNGAILVVPMDRITSARINGRDIGESVLVLKGNSDCIVYEPEGRLVGVIALRSVANRSPWNTLSDGVHLQDIVPDDLLSLQRTITGILDTAANNSAPWGLLDRKVLEEPLLAALDDTIGQTLDRYDDRSAINTYHQIVSRMDAAIRSDPAARHSLSDIAELAGVSLRTLSTATHLVCGQSPHRYGHILRLWAVRQRLRTGSAGLTVRASARSHGFQHMGEFAELYRMAFGEFPSQTLARAASGRLHTGGKATYPDK